MDSDTKIIFGWILVFAVIMVTMMASDSFDKRTQAQRDIELARLRCAPSAAPSVSAP